MQTERIKKRAPAADLVTRSVVERQLNWAVDGGRNQHRDPLAQVTESFQQTFDHIGRRRAEQLAEADGTGASAREPETEETSVRLAGIMNAQRKAGSRELSARSYGGLSPMPIRTFSQIAFQRGQLASAVLQGTGRMMLATCLRRSVGQEEPVQSRQTLFGANSQVRTVPGSSPDQMVFYRGFAQSAMGLVIDVLSDARSVVDTLAEMAGGTNALGENEGAQTLRRVYPFLNDSREQELLEQYRTQLADTTDVQERQVLQNAIVHTGALVARKAQMKSEFINKLRLIADKAEQTLEELQNEDTLAYLTAAMAAEEEHPPLEPPDEPPDGKGGTKSSAECRKETSLDEAEQPDGDKHPQRTEPSQTTVPQSEVWTADP